MIRLSAAPARCRREELTTAYRETATRPMHDLPLDSARVEGDFARFGAFRSPAGAVRVGDGWLLLETGQAELSVDRATAWLAQNAPGPGSRSGRRPDGARSFAPVRFSARLAPFSGRSVTARSTQPVLLWLHAGPGMPAMLPGPHAVAGHGDRVLSRR